MSEFDQTFNDEQDFPTGTITEPTSYTPVPKAAYRARAARIEFVDPVAMGWEVPEGAAERMAAFMRAPFIRVAWQITGTKDGGPTEYEGRTVDQRVSLQPGTNPKTGRSNLEGAADLIRLRDGVGRGDEVVGRSLWDASGLAGLSREDRVATITQQLQVLNGLEATVRVAHRKGKGRTDRVVEIVLD